MRVHGKAEQWTTEVNIGAKGVHKVYVGKVNRLGRTLIEYYRKVTEKHLSWQRQIRGDRNDPDYKLPDSAWIGIDMEAAHKGLPKGIDREDDVQFKITELLQ
jgi:hypothetical protein